MPVERIHGHLLLPSGVLSRALLPPAILSGALRARQLLHPGRDTQLPQLVFGDVMAPGRRPASIASIACAQRRSTDSRLVPSRREISASARPWISATSACAASVGSPAISPASMHRSI